MTDLSPVDAMTNDYRALCEKLVGTWDARHDLRFIDWIDSITDIVDRARALLAEPVAEGPSDEELWELARPFSEEVGDGFTSMVDDEIGFARAVLAKWGANAQ